MSLRHCPVAADTARHYAELDRMEAESSHVEECRERIEQQRGAILRALVESLSTTSACEDDEFEEAFRTDAEEFGRLLWRLTDKELDRQAKALAESERKQDREPDVYDD